MFGRIVIKIFYTRLQSLWKHKKVVVWKYINKLKKKNQTVQINKKKKITWTVLLAII